MNLGYVLLRLRRYEEAGLAFDRAIEIKPDFVSAIANKGLALYYSHKFEEAEIVVRNAIEIFSRLPDDARSDQQKSGEASAHHNLAMLLLSQGDLANGLDEFEWRWTVSLLRQMRQFAGRPLWENDENLTVEQQVAGKTLFLWHDQGLGDTIHFIRFVYELAKLDCEIIVEVQPGLYKLFTESFSLPNVSFVRTGEEPRKFDMHLPLLSLPRMLGITYDNLPEFKAYLRPDESEIDSWRKKLNAITPDENRKKRKIGIVWAGNPEHTADPDRSMSRETIASLVAANRNRFQFYGLQLGDQAQTEIPDVINLAAFLTDFSVTAAIVTNLDLVIAVDTAIVHLTGAFGRPVWTMLYHTPDWRWRMDKNGIGEKTTPWYPSMSLFWQKKPGVWDDVIQEVSEKLAAI
jgi:hypothetical protein